MQQAKAIAPDFSQISFCVFDMSPKPRFVWQNNRVCWMKSQDLLHLLLPVQVRRHYHNIKRPFYVQIFSMRQPSIPHSTDLNVINRRRKANAPPGNMCFSLPLVSIHCFGPKIMYVFSCVFIFLYWIHRRRDWKVAGKIVGKVIQAQLHRKIYMSKERR